MINTSIIIPAISTFIACGALMVANKAHSQSIKSRKDDKIMKLRIQIVELKYKFTEIKEKSLKLSKQQPSEHDDATHKTLNEVINTIESIHKNMYKDDFKLSTKYVHDAGVSIHDISNDLTRIDLKLNEFIK